MYLAITKEYRSYKIVILLLIESMLINARNRSNKTALILISNRKEPIITNYLLLFNTNIQATNTASYNTLCLIIIRLDIYYYHSYINLILLVEILLAYNVNINRIRQAVLSIILVIKHKSLNTEPSKNLAYTIIKALLDASTNIKKPNTTGFTPLYR